MILGIAFDLDGTLIDSAETLMISWSSAFRDIGLDVKPSEIRRYVGLSPAQIASAFAGNLSNEDVERLKRLRKKYFLENIWRIRVFPEVFPTLLKLKEVHVKSSIATSMGKDMVDEIVKRFRLDEHVCCWVSSEEVSNPKPEPDVFLKAFEKMNLTPKECMSVGDREYDVIAGKKAGSMTALVVRDEFSRSESVKPDYTIRDLSELPAIISKINGIQKSL